jgi:Ribbon-Helix-Helix transcriptional regulator family
MDASHGRQCARPSTPDPGYREDHGQSWLCRSRSGRSDGAGGFYSNRTDFIRTAIRNQLERHADVVKQSTVRKSLDLGLRYYSRADLEAVQRAGEALHINVLGLATIAQDVTPELARAAIASVSVLGALHASRAVKSAPWTRLHPHEPDRCERARRLRALERSRRRSRLVGWQSRRLLHRSARASSSSTRSRPSSRSSGAFPN